MLGHRLDQIGFKNASTGRVFNPSDPRVLAHKFGLNEWDFDYLEWRMRLACLGFNLCMAILVATAPLRADPLPALRVDAGDEAWGATELARESFADSSWRGTGDRVMS